VRNSTSENIFVIWIRIRGEYQYIIKIKLQWKYRITYYFINKVILLLLELNIILMYFARFLRKRGLNIFDLPVRITALYIPLLKKD